MAGQRRWQECEAAGHTGSTVRERGAGESNTYVQSTFPILFSQEPQPHRVAPPTFRIGLPISLNLI